ncbi:MAG: hypothetical protein OEU26_29425 [Candidatus Tectomicrobia bacterium]|nr:hypothetical protein [Candidatus Tectomicrobia bacterium]
MQPSWRNRTAHSGSVQRCSGVVIGLLLLPILLQACGIGTRARALVGSKMRMQVQVSDNVNQQSPVALDLVLVYDKKLLKKLSNLPASDWFKQRRQYRRDYPDSTGFDAWRWEWVPGQNVPLQELPLKAKAKGGLIFVNYFSDGDHRARIEPNKSIYVDLHETDFAVQPLR